MDAHNGTPPLPDEIFLPDIIGNVLSYMGWLKDENADLKGTIANLERENAELKVKIQRMENDRIVFKTETDVKPLLASLQLASSTTDDQPAPAIEPISSTLVAIESQLEDSTSGESMILNQKSSPTVESCAYGTPPIQVPPDAGEALVESSEDDLSPASGRSTTLPSDFPESEPATRISPSLPARHKCLPRRPLPRRPLRVAQPSSESLPKSPMQSFTCSKSDYSATVNASQNPASLTCEGTFIASPIFDADELPPVNLPTKVMNDSLENASSLSAVACISSPPLSLRVASTAVVKTEDGPPEIAGVTTEDVLVQPALEKRDFLFYPSSSPETVQFPSPCPTPVKKLSLHEAINLTRAPTSSPKKRKSAASISSASSNKKTRQTEANGAEPNTSLATPQTPKKPRVPLPGPKFAQWKKENPNPLEGWNEMGRPIPAASLPLSLSLRSVATPTRPLPPRHKPTEALSLPILPRAGSTPPPAGYIVPLEEPHTRFRANRSRYNPVTQQKEIIVPSQIKERDQSSYGEAVKSSPL